jgi:hypothetical protein
MLSGGDFDGDECKRRLQRPSHPAEADFRPSCVLGRRARSGCVLSVAVCVWR